MGRGLSFHQKKILSFVLKERIARCEDLLSLWGVQPGAVVDKGKYDSAHSALSRSLTRLFLRGFITYWQDKLTHYRTAVTLTEAGKSMAQSIILDDEE
ncbi:MAG: hypothetical protein D4R73_08570 [Deltaproteobacteria bacterium]|nr:MAG: hypothetical protein D4R73_08570 [Deltaproteobacteria bacterium]